MNYIEKLADRIIQHSLHDPNQLADKSLLDAVETELYKIDSDKDKMTLLRILLEQSAKQHSRHKDGCPHGESCGLDFKYERVNYYLTQELNQLGIVTDNDQFTPEEKQNEESKLDAILEHLKTSMAENSQQFEQLKAEIEELKNHFILGKKTFRQLAIGKFQDMAMSGVVGHAVSLALTEGMKHL